MGRENVVQPAVQATNIDHRVSVLIMEPRNEYSMPGVSASSTFLTFLTGTVSLLDCAGNWRG